MSTSVKDGERLWEPSETAKEQSNLREYMQWLWANKGLDVFTQEALWEWSVNNLEDFWTSMWDFFQIKASQPYTTVLVERKMPGAKWFVGAELNYAEHAFRNATSQRPALLFQSERQPLTEVSWDELAQNVASLAQALRKMGVQRGDRVVSYMPNIPETLTAFLACASIGAIWSSCSPDFGTSSVIDRFKQIEPTILFAVDGYQYNGKAVNRRGVIPELQTALPTLKKTVLVPYLSVDASTEGSPDIVMWSDLLTEQGELSFEQVPFDHPNDRDGKRYHDSYFDMYPGIWRHGDWIKITPRGSAIIYGRSDSTINRQGIRMGSSEIYRVVEGIPEVMDSLTVGIELPGGKYYMPLFVVLRDQLPLGQGPHG